MNTNIFFSLDYELQLKIVESILFAADEPIDTHSLYNLLIDEKRNTIIEEENGDINQKANQALLDEKFRTIDKLIDDINTQLHETNRPYKIIKIAGGWQFATRKEYGQYVRTYYKTKINRRLSNAALEVLAIIAYKQPITKPEIELIRGVNSNEVVNSILERGLIKISGRKNVLGRPLMYSTTDDFLRIFGLNSLSDLPELSEFEEMVKQEFENQADDTVTLDLSNDEIENIEAHIEIEQN